MNPTPQIVPITDLRKSSPDVLDLLSNGPVFLAQRSRPAAVLLSTQQWDSLNMQLEEMTTLVDYLEVKLKLALGETTLEDVDLAELKAELYGVPA
ncbi:MAG: type II toxin-antitoxin system Phd/YefM family antitoxin [Caldilineaceae bacterium]|nr:type II toxin-antitoxin system Phd/YefM family antitoxin [Caldilineaceae bacterium]MBP8109672.1 type II toxin-antitoxin system Phd/YefM family antitoxin [Caldilineaceae bacterium]MBP8125508.1 type II toxin-antitoxin system Phd/YefM family antitoxin [Caldilineaceae bacterium]MBP9073606.1 type II toxin-antitoxin system Phd/YefM family antitoxin [Caldilineaceae bacterium]